MDPTHRLGLELLPYPSALPAPWVGPKMELAHLQATPPAQPVSPQKLQLVLAPLHSLASLALEQGLPDPSSLLAHSLRQLDRIDSLSEQVSFLEEQLGSCECCPGGPHAHPVILDIPCSVLCPEGEEEKPQAGERRGGGALRGVGQTQKGWKMVGSGDL